MAIPCNRRDTFGQLRLQLDGDDNFMQGFQVGRPNRKRHMPFPIWFNNQKHVLEFLQQRFPRMTEKCLKGIAPDRRRECSCIPCKQVCLATDWDYVIRLYFRFRERAKDIAEDLGIKVSRIEKLVATIKHAAAGKRLDGRERTHGKAGRPRKKDLTHASDEACPLFSVGTKLIIPQEAHAYSTKY